MKKILCSLLAIVLLANTQIVNASTDIPTTNNGNTTIEYLEDGYKVITTIEYECDTDIAPSLNKSAKLMAIPMPPSGTRSGKKTTVFYNKSNEKLWSVTVHGKFSYTLGYTSQCTSATVSTKSYVDIWKVSDATASKSGNKATAKATGTEYYLFLPAGSITQSVSITCNIYGTLS